MKLSVPEAPDYARSEAWACLPPADHALSADVFYAPGTLLKGEGPGYFDTANPDHRALARRPRLVQASAFALAGDIYQPHVRQVSMEVNVLPRDQVLAAYEVAYADLRRAFLHYLERWNRGRPFFLAGNSQGSALLLALLKDVLADPAILSRLIAAYIIGFSVTPADMAAHPGMRLAQRRDDSGVIISYNTLTRDASSALTLAEGALCVNPLNWSCGPEYASADLNLGRVDFDLEGRVSRETPRFTDAWIDTDLGALRIGALNAADIESGEYFLPGDLHHYNYTFFYRNLEENALTRVRAFLAKRPCDL